jgi:hypothetical protein
VVEPDQQIHYLADAPLVAGVDDLPSMGDALAKADRRNASTDEVSYQFDILIATHERDSGASLPKKVANDIYLLIVRAIRDQHPIALTQCLAGECSDESGKELVPWFAAYYTD